MNLHVKARWRSLRKRVRSVVRPPNGPPVLVFQMGKVGSSSVYRSLLASDLRREIDHVHLLADLDAVEASVRARYPDPRQTLQQIDKARALRARVLAAEGTQWSVITLVRDPVQRNVSAFFESLTEVIPDAYTRAEGDGPTVEELRSAFVDRFDHGAPLAWFRTQMEPVFGIDVFATPFPTDRGWATYESPSARLLVLRLEDLHARGAQAIGEFLGLDDFTLLPANVGSTKAYAELYAAFGAQVQLPDASLDRMYDSEFARHFYSEAEIERFRRRWTSAP